MSVPSSSSQPAPTASAPGAARDHRTHPVAVRRVVDETAEAASLVFDVPPEQADAFAYEAGQFVTLRVEVDGSTQHRCYSMSSTPGVDDELQVTVKRVPGGVVSNWLLDHVEAGTVLDVTFPAGTFRLRPDERDVVCFAAGSGITPVFSIVKAALAGTDRRVRLLYANRDTESVIFAHHIAELAERHPDRLEVVHHLDVDRGFVDPVAVRTFLGGTPSPDTGFYLCGPAPFMDLVEAALADAGVDVAHVHVERFTPVEVEHEPIAAEVSAQVTIDLDGRVVSTEHRPGTTILQTARSVGLVPPYSCEAGNCATCMARLVEGTATMYVNDALTDEEVAEGWVLTCQAVPTSPTVHVVYGFEGA